MDSVIRPLVSTPTSSALPILPVSLLPSSNYQYDQAFQNLDLTLTGHSPAITDRSEENRVSRIETFARNQPHASSGTRVSTNQPEKFVESQSKGKDPRRGPPGVQWNETTDRQYARMYSISNAHIEDLPILMNGGGPKFKKRIAQEKAVSNLGPQPNKLRPDAGDPKQMDERIEQAYILKRYLQNQRHGNRNKHTAVLEMSYNNVEELEKDYEIENAISSRRLSASSRASYEFLDDFENAISSRRLSASDRASYQFHDDFENFAKSPAVLARVQSLRRHLLAEQSQRHYSDETLAKFLYVQQRLSYGSFPSNDSNTCSSLSKRNSLASDFSSSIGRPILGSIRRSRPAVPTRATLENMLLGEHVNMDEGPAPYEVVQGFPHIGDFQPEPSTPGNITARPVCCLHRCRGDPRVDKCPYCEYEMPESHQFVVSLLKDARKGEDAILNHAQRPPAINFHEVDDFGDTVLHLAASLGAGSMILDWFISMEVDVHARNAAGQTFMHVLNPASFAGYWNHSAERVGEKGVLLLLHHLRVKNFDYNAQDDFGQTPMHALARFWLNAQFIKLVLDICPAPGSTLLRRDFQGQSVEDRIRAQASFDHNGFPDQRRESEINALLRNAFERESAIPKQQSFSDKLHLPSPSTSVSKEESNNVKPSRYDAMMQTITTALLGFPGIEYRGRNALHCLAESCIGSRIGAQYSNAPSKRKRQEHKTLRRDYIVSHVEMLLQAGVNPDDYDINGNTPLMAFIRNDLSPEPERQITADVLRLLIGAGANVHRRNPKGETALHLAVRFGRPSAVDILLSSHANVHARARRGEGVLEVASKWALRSKRDGGRYHRIMTCMAIAGRYHAILGPSSKDDWDERRRCIAAV